MDHNQAGQNAAGINKWHMSSDLQQEKERNVEVGLIPKRLGVSWNNLTIKGVGSNAAFNENVLSQLNPFHKTNKGELKTIVDKSHGTVKPGQMLLVLGRPGAGCTSLLSVLANNRRGFEEVTGDVSFGIMSPDDAKQYNGEIIMNTEEEIFFPNLSVEDTIDFAARMKVPYRLPEGIKSPEEHAQFNKEFLLRSVGISHTIKTKVGDAFIRGVSGGERKRVSIIEALASRGSVFCWDNSTRGLDASTALDWVKAIRAMTDSLGLTTIVTLYQAGNGIYNHFDKVLVLDEGKQIFYGPQKDAVPFMEDLGFMHDAGSNLGDFLTGVTVPTERTIRSGYEATFPRTADEILSAYDKSSIKAQMLEESSAYQQSKTVAKDTEEFKQTVALEKHRGVPTKSANTTNFAHQVHTAVIRQFQLMWGDKSTLIIKQGATVVQALLGGSLFYDAPDNSLGLFLKGGALFFSILYNALIALSEVTDSFTGRPVLTKHRSFALYHPAAIVIAQVTVDIPVLLFQVTHFGLVLYWMVGLKATAGAFFTYLVTNFMTAMSMTAFFRFLGAASPTLDAATKVSGLSIVALFVYMGYMIIKPEMHPWFVWIFWINPMAYAFESLLGNEFHGKVLPCVGPNLVPNEPGYGSVADGQACVGVTGAPPGASSVTGDQYLTAMSFSHSHIWRNFGIICAWWVLFVALTAVFTSMWKTQKAKVVVDCSFQESNSTSRNAFWGPETKKCKLRKK